MKTIEMNFLPDVYVTCDVCNGKRFKQEVLDVQYKGKSIYDILDLSIDEAMDFFADSKEIIAKIKDCIPLQLNLSFTINFLKKYVFESWNFDKFDIFEDIF